MKKIVIDSDSSTIALSSISDGAPVGASSKGGSSKKLFVAYFPHGCVLIEGGTGRIVESADNVKELVSKCSDTYSFFVFDGFPYLFMWASGAINTDVTVVRGCGGIYAGEIMHTYELRRRFNEN